MRLTGPLGAGGIRFVAGNDFDRVYPERVSLADIVVIQRDFPRRSDAYRSVVEQARAERKRIIFDLDDLLFELPDDHPDRLSRYYDNALLPMALAMVEADVVTVSTPALAVYCRAFNPNTHTLPNYLNDRLWPLRPAAPVSDTPPGAAVVVGYMGGNSHLPDLQLIQPVIRKVARKYGYVRFRFWGGMPPDEIAEDVGRERVDWVPLDLPNYAQFAGLFSAARCDIFIAPLQDNPFNQCKSAIKFLEYSSLGIPGVYSRALPYEDIVAHGENGMLVRFPEEWEGALSSLIESPELRRRLGANAQATVKRDWLLSQHAHEWSDLCRRVASPEFLPADSAAAARVARQAITWRQLEQSADHTAERDADVADLREEIRRRGAAVGELSQRLAQMQTVNNLMQGIIDRAEAQTSRQAALIQGYENGRIMRLMVAAQSQLNRLLGRAAGADAGSSLPAPAAAPPAVTVSPAARTQDAPPAGDYKARLARLYSSALDSFLASGRKLTLPVAQAPVVSILLVLHNRAELTLPCVRSLADGASCPFEVVIVDNASTDQTPALLNRVDGATVIHNDANLGFVLACNQAARAARGEFLLFLNNDAQLMPGAVDSAMDTLRSSGDVGAVGGKVILLDGSLQEAGSIVWNDGSCLGYGRGDSPSAPPYNFVRDVDYCSGAFLLTRRALFERAGGFDETFQPAYYEETDYCLSLWQAGRRVVYDPGAAVLHYEFGSSEPGEPRAATQLQLGHRRILAHKHAAWLASKYQASAANQLWARSARVGERRALFIDDRVPHPSLGSGLPRAREILLSLQQAGYFVTFYPLNKPAEAWDSVYADIPKTVEVMLDHGGAKLAAFLSERQGYYGAIVASRPHNFTALQYLIDQHPDWFSHTRIIYDAEAIYAYRGVAQRRLRGETVTDAELEELVEQEIALARGAHAVICVSDVECARFAARGYRRVYKLGHALTPEPTPNPFEARDGVLFVGGILNDRTPNADAVYWFVDEILPILRRQLDRPVAFTVAGPNESRQLAQRTGHQARVTGEVADLTPYYDGARVFVAPTRFAAGIPLKVYEAAARGVPVVCTSLLASQLGWRHGQELLVADDAASFAAQCARLCADRDLWESIRANALQRVSVECSREAFQKTVEEILLL